MCLGIPVKIIEIRNNNKALCGYLGVEKEIDIRFTPRVKEGEFVLLHAGFAIQVVNKKNAQKVYDILDEIDS